MHLQRRIKYFHCKHKTMSKINEDLKEELKLLNKEILSIKISFRELFYKLLKENKINIVSGSKNLEPITFQYFLFKYQIGNNDEKVFKLLNFVLYSDAKHKICFLNEMIERKYLFIMNFIQENESLLTLYKQYISAYNLKSSLSLSNKSKTKIHIITLGRGKK
jgi:hypothetical protein